VSSRKLVTILHIERHVFGSHKGYTTLAKSAGISAEDARQLEAGVYGFGQTEDRHYAKSLRTKPAYFTRVLRGGRRGLTRVFEGSPDVAGRATDLMITLVLGNADWDGKLYGDISLLLNEDKIWKWSGGSQIEGIDCSYALPAPMISRKSAGKVAALISEIERRWPVPSPIVVGSSDFSDNEIRAVETLIPPASRMQFTSACRSLSPQLTVTLNQLASEAPLQTMNYHYDATASTSPYAQFLLSNGLADGQISIGEVLTYRNFGQPRRTAPIAAKAYPPPPPMPIEQHRRSWIIAIAGVVIIAAVLAAIYIRNRINHAAIVVTMPAPHLSDPVAPATSPITMSPHRALPQADLDNAAHSLRSNVPATQPAIEIANETPIETRSEIASPQSPDESQQDKDLRKLERDWHRFFAVISHDSLTFDESQMKMLHQLQNEMKRKGLVHRVELESTNSVSMLPVLSDLRNQYVQVNSILSDDRIKDTAKLQLAERQLEGSVRKAKTFLISVTTAPAEDSKIETIFATIDAAIDEAKMRLKEAGKD
jgi:hypothetical protein